MKSVEGMGETTIFDRSGLASVIDLASETWKTVFATLEREQSAFLSKDYLFRTRDYIWPRDALHSWSRVWEYPYIYYHLQEYQKTRGGDEVVVDLGSGVTFFPFALSHLGYRVICIDRDPACETGFRLAREHVSSSPGTVEFRLNDGFSLPLGDAEVEALYCISVLEHIPHFERIIDEVARVLKPGGLFLLTFDVDLQGNSQIGISEYRRLDESLRSSFALLHPEKTIHPSETLHSKTGPYPLMLPKHVRLLNSLGLEWWVERRLAQSIYGGAKGVHLAVQGMAMKKRS